MEEFPKIQANAEQQDTGYQTGRISDGTMSKLNSLDTAYSVVEKLEEELKSKTQEILKLQETLRRHEEEKEDISKNFVLVKRQIEDRLQDLSESQRTQSEDNGVVEESLEFKRSGYNDDVDEVNSIKSEKDRPTSMSIRSLETCQPPMRKPNVETEFWSEDDEMVATNPIFETQTISCNQTGFDNFFQVNLKNYGLSVFDEDSGDLLTHIEEVNRCAEEAGEMGATEFQKIRLLMMSLPKEMKYVESFVPTAKKTEYKDFSEEVVKILSDKIRTVMNKFLTTQRGPGESILKFFHRISQMYKNSNALVGTDWEMDAGHVTGIYTKIHQALSDAEKHELNRRLDDKLEKRNLTVFELRRVLVEISKLRSQKPIEIRSFKLDTKTHHLTIMQNEELNN